MRTKWGDRAARRGDIVRAGRSLLREDGLAALQMRDVARRAGVGLGTVYTYFPTKEALFAALYADRLDQMLSDLAPTLSATTHLEKLLVLVATSYRDVYAEFGDNDADYVRRFYAFGPRGMALTEFGAGEIEFCHLDRVLK